MSEDDQPEPEQSREERSKRFRWEPRDIKVVPPPKDAPKPRPKSPE